MLLKLNYIINKISMKFLLKLYFYAIKFSIFFNKIFSCFCTTYIIESWLVTFTLRYVLAIIGRRQSAVVSETEIEQETENLEADS